MTRREDLIEQLTDKLMRKLKRGADAGEIVEFYAAIHEMHGLEIERQVADEIGRRLGR